MDNCVVLHFSESEISSATSGYAQERLLGSGGFGVVYKGILNGSYVAIKKLTEVILIVIIIVLSIGHFQDGALALAGGQEKRLPDSFTLSGLLASEIRALTRYR